MKPLPPLRIEIVALSDGLMVRATRAGRPVGHGIAEGNTSDATLRAALRDLSAHIRR